MSNKQVYSTLSTGEECTAAQLIAEIMTLRYAKKAGISTAGRWWNENKLLKKKYKEQIIAASGLLKIYKPAAILNALKRKECSWQYSLRVKGMNDIFLEEQQKLDKIQQNIIESTRVYSKDTITEIKKYGQQSKLDKLRD